MDVKDVPHSHSILSRVRLGTSSLLSLLEGAAQSWPCTSGRDSLPPHAPTWCRGSITRHATVFGAERRRALREPVPSWPTCQHSRRKQLRNGTEFTSRIKPILVLLDVEVVSGEKIVEYEKYTGFQTYCATI